METSFKIELEKPGKARVHRGKTMYPEYQGKLAPEFREAYPMSRVLGENLLYISSWILAGALVWPLQVKGWPLLTLLWAAVILGTQVLLKKHICSGCYYYGKTCHLGWGKLAAYMFPKDSGNLLLGTRLTLVYVLSPPIFLALALLIGWWLHPGMWHWVFLSVYVVLTILTFPVRKKGCAECALREICPGSAVRKRR